MRLRRASHVLLAVAVAPVALVGPAGAARRGVPSGAGDPQVPLYGVFERTFSEGGSYANPYAEAEAAAVVTRPDGSTRSLPLFWDGGDSWTMRLSPDAPGQWTFRVVSGDPGLDGQTGIFDAVPSTSHGGIRARVDFPHHFERQDGTPFWWMGDTLWTGFGRDVAEGLDHAAVLHYLDVRAAQGFNYVHASLMDPGTNEGGDVFFSVSEETLNPAYFQEVDERVRQMNSRGITAGIMLAWANGDPSWASFSSDVARQRYARYVAARYGAYDVGFIVSGEWDESGVKATYQAIGNEIRASDPHGRPIAIHATGSVEEFADEAWMSFGDYQQLYSTLHANILEARDHAKPVVNAEYAYYLRDQDGDGVVDKPNSATLAEIRHATWDIVMAGGYFVTGWGTTYLGGISEPGPFNPDDPRNDDWEEDVQHVATLFSGLEWWALEPGDGLLTGPGTHYCLARVGQQYVAYVRGSSGPLALSLAGAPDAKYDVRLYDPRTGAFSARPRHAGAGPLTLAPPDAEDWVFVVRRVERPRSARFHAEADTYVDETSPDASYGKTPALAVGGAPQRRETFLRFNVSGLPAGAVVQDARVVLAVAEGSTSTGGTIRLFAPAVEAWDELQPTWGKPLEGSDASGDLASVGPVAAGGRCVFADLESVVSGNGRLTFVIRSTAGDGAAYHSRESPWSGPPSVASSEPSVTAGMMRPTGRWPFLHLTYVTGEAVASPAITPDGGSFGGPVSVPSRRPAPF